MHDIALMPETDYEWLADLLSKEASGLSGVWGSRLITASKLTDILREIVQRGVRLYSVRVLGADIIGAFIVSHMNYMFQSGEIGLVLAQEHRGQSHGTNATLLFLRRIAFGELSLNRVAVNALATNAPALAMTRRLGFREEGRIPGSVHVWGRYEESVHFSLLRAECPS